jgi:hypothetical protein
LLSDFRSTAPLPQAESAIAEVIGRGPAIALSHRVLHKNPFRQGKDSVRGVLYVPKKPTARFLELVGNVEHARALCATMPGEQLLLSGCRQVMKQTQHHVTRRLYNCGVPIAELSRLTGITGRQVRNIVAGERVTIAPPADIAHWKRGLYAHSFLIRVKPVNLE